MKISVTFRTAFAVLFLLMTFKMNAQQNLTAAEQNLATISALTATGKIPELKSELNNGLNNGLTVNEIKEALVQLYAYCGFPRSLNALNTFKTVLDERKAKGINDKIGVPNITENKSADKYEQGRKLLEELTKTPQTKPAPGFGEFAPRIDNFLKEHLFADVFASKVLTYRQRELVTISALAAMEGVEAQLKSHIAMGKNTGITDAQLAEITGLIEQHISRTQANILRRNISLPELPVIENDMIVRIAEVLVEPKYLQEYLVFAKENATASLKNEPGVISIFPMQMKENPNLVRIVEIYKNKDTYEKHIQSVHFQKYKQGTLKMVKDLKLLDSNALSLEGMTDIFKRLK